MLGDLRTVVGKNVDNTESFVLALWLISGLAGLGVLTATLSLFAGYSLGTEFATLLGGTWTYAHVIGFGAIAYSMYTSEFGIDAFQELDPQEQAIVVAGLAAFVVTGYPSSGLFNFLTSSDVITLVAAAAQGASLFTINDTA